MGHPYFFKSPNYETINHEKNRIPPGPSNWTLNPRGSIMTKQCKTCLIETRINFFVRSLVKIKITFLSVIRTNKDCTRDQGESWVMPKNETSKKRQKETHETLNDKTSK